MATAGGPRSPADLAELPLGPGQVALWWLGQAGFAVRGGGATLLIDPFLSTGHDRLVPRPFAPERATGVDAILCTHEHIDHLDADSLPALAAASPGAAVIVPAPIVSQVTDLGIAAGRVIGAEPDRPIELPGATVHPLPSWHGTDMADAYGFGLDLPGGGYRYLGYVVEADGVRVYHSGDTLVYEGMEERLRRLAPHVALLPINGRDRFREEQNIVGNMDHREAARLAVDVGVDLLVPMHFEMFAINLGFPAHLVDFVQRHHPGLAVMLPDRVRPFVCTAGW
jgi:L-ascorbate metabolism protein UlaG (beta-lactamase superfamily)